MMSVKLPTGDLEPFVDAIRAAQFLSLRPRRVLELARQGILPGHPIGTGKRCFWRFRLSEIAATVASAEQSGLASQKRPSIVRPKAVPGTIGTET